MVTFNKNYQFYMLFSEKFAWFADGMKDCEHAC